ncbi:MAG TPA: hypothetical protein VN327_13180 [Pseudonocardiaceae bacterium]|nr:hypothetical protein [Pseudonocardiaceae bacterium]
MGCIVDWAAFMRLRAQRPVIPGEPDDFDAIADRGRTDVDLADLLAEHARFGIGLRVPDCRLTWELGQDGYLSTLWLLAPDSWACVHDTVVRQAGARRLWDEVSTAYSWWQHSGRPTRHQYGVTVTAGGIPHCRLDLNTRLKKTMPLGSHLVKVASHRAQQLLGCRRQAATQCRRAAAGESAGEVLGTVVDLGLREFPDPDVVRAIYRPDDELLRERVPRLPAPQTGYPEL